MKAFLFLLLISGWLSQQLVAQNRDSIAGKLHSIRIVDSLTAKDLAARNPILSTKEVDSLVNNIYLAKQQEPVPIINNSVEAGNTFDVYPFLIAGMLLIIFFLVYILWRTQRRLSAQVAGLSSTIKKAASSEDGVIVHVNEEGRLSVKADQPEKLPLKTAEKGKSVAVQSAQVAQEFEAIRKKINAVYKVKNYPGYAGQKPAAALMNVFELEKNMALYSYEQFLKPITSILDANKNNPSRMRQAEQQQVVERLLSMALFYSEYLYLRVQDLSVGGHIAHRLDQYSKGEGIDKALLKPLSTEHGSRALALRMALEKLSISELSYPVFDETNLNTQ